MLRLQLLLFGIAITGITTVQAMPFSRPQTGLVVRSQLDVASASIGPLITGATQSIRLLTGLIATLITLVTMRPTIVDIPGGGTTTGPDTDANLQQLRPVPIMHFCEHASSLPLTNPSWLASVYSTCSRPSPTLDFYTRYNSSERVRR